MPTLKYWDVASNSWKPVGAGGGGGGGVDEVWIGDTMPTGPLELWVDTDEPGVTVAPSFFPYAMAAGVTNVVSSAAATSYAATATFPAGRFSQVPIVIANIALGTINILVNVSAPTLNDVVFTIFHKTAGAMVTSGTFPIHWVAYQMLPSAAAG